MLPARIARYDTLNPLSDILIILIHRISCPVHILLPGGVLQRAPALSFLLHPEAFPCNTVPVCPVSEATSSWYSLRVQHPVDTNRIDLSASSCNPAI